MFVYNRVCVSDHLENVQILNCTVCTTTRAVLTPSHQYNRKLQNSFCRLYCKRSQFYSHTKHIIIIIKYTVFDFVRHCLNSVWDKLWIYRIIILFWNFDCYICHSSRSYKLYRYYDRWQYKSVNAYNFILYYLCRKRIHNV